MQLEAERIRGVATTDDEVDFARLEGGPWDGRRFSYIAPARLRIAGRLQILSECAEVDPIDYQILRWRLWGLNLEHADTIRRVSGTPVIVFMEDFATAVLTARGDTVVCSPTIQYFTGMADLVVKWTLENRSENPGIEDGDVFLQNDPYIGTTHQLDTAMYAPVFWEGALIAWVFNSCHVGDIGGNTPGSFCINTNDIFDEPLPIPPVKIARAGALLADVVDLFVRQSRTPEMIALQLRSQFAGIQATRRRLLEIVARYGPGAINGVMHQVIDDCAAMVGKRLARIPDGTWRSAIQFGGLTQAPDRVHRVVTTIRKQGDMLTCSNEGTDAQIATGNCTFAAWRSDLICVLANQLAYDQLGCPAGVLRHMRFRPVPGRINCAVHPAAVTSLIGNNMTLASASQASSLMLLSGPPELAASSFTVGTGVGGFWLCNWDGADGRRHGNLTGDPLAAASGASAVRDGVDQGGGWFTPQCTAGDIEEWEDTMPLLYLYRRDATDSGGPGRFRGGNGLVSGFLTSRAGNPTAQVIGPDASINATLGLAGGAPGTPGAFRIVPGKDLRARLAEARTAEVVHDIVAPGARLESGTMTPIGPDDVVLATFAGAGGFGDPLRRPTAQIAEDLRHRLISPAFAAAGYGAVLHDDGAVDEDRTAERREALRQERLTLSDPPQAPCEGRLEPGQLIHAAGGDLAVGIKEGAVVWACAGCGTQIGRLEANYKHGCRTRALPLAAAGPLATRDYGMVTRHHYCPGCGTMLALEVCHADAPPLRDIEIDAASLSERANPPERAQ